MALVPTTDEPDRDRPSPRAPARLPAEGRRGLRQALEDALGRSADRVLLAGTVTDAIAALGAGLWTPAHATPPLPRAPRPGWVGDELGLTLHAIPSWHLAEGRAVADEELVDPSPRRRERAARLAAAAAGARRHGARTVLAGAGAAPIHAAGLTLDQARACIERYDLELVTPLADPTVQTRLHEAAVASARWLGLSWPAWPLREAMVDHLGARLAWPRAGLGQAGPGK
jgi:hypothetical protein